MTLIEAKKFFELKLNEQYSQGELNFYYKYILRDCFNVFPAQLALNPSLELKNKEIKVLKNIISQLLNEKPLQYILGKASFRSLVLKVNKNVLIPRPETEELVGWIIEDHFQIKNKQMSVLDVGTGSGCIAIALAKEQDLFNVHAFDKQKVILNLAKENAELNGVNINLFKCDIQEIKSINLNYDIIVSNPPYILPSEKKLMKKNVLDFEPHNALFVTQKDPLIHYRSIIEFSKTNLNNNGFLYLEINPKFKRKLIDLVDNKCFIISERKDIFGKDRMLRIQRI